MHSDILQLAPQYALFKLVVLCCSIMCSRIFMNASRSTSSNNTLESALASTKKIYGGTYTIT